MDTIALSIPVEGGVQDTSFIPATNTERTDVANDMHGPALRAHEADLAKEATSLMNRVTGKGTIIDQMI
ncbi:hypothetical protein [Maridesulfovibrio ferrireducens]|uniref:hypothetical protein n=1 Tax=Maridesulfovibrio ferrireducens TaxID=246191 RepID=UPI001A3214E2|nr:hypothetical protein [Maridesulfovibrio ferrireducens]MBI9110419.1 hypothetical protein [Maridesulfovibrio ferrireducens]